MSNLVSILLGMVLSILPSEKIQEKQEVVQNSCTIFYQNRTAQNLQNLNPKHQISKEELALSNWEEQIKN